MAEKTDEGEKCPYCGAQNSIVRERSPDGHTSCSSCRVKHKHAAWGVTPAMPTTPAMPDETSQPSLALAPAEPAPVQLAAKRKTLTLASMLKVSLAKEVHERLEALDEMYGQLGPRAVLSMLITDAYMDRLAAFREAEGE